MKYKKVLISMVALIAVAAAIYGVWNWQQKSASQPTRQGQEIR